MRSSPGGSLCGCWVGLTGLVGLGLVGFVMYVFMYLSILRFLFWSVLLCSGLLCSVLFSSTAKYVRSSRTKSGSTAEEVMMGLLGSYSWQIRYVSRDRYIGKREEHAFRCFFFSIKIHKHRYRVRYPLPAAGRKNQIRSDQIRSDRGVLVRRSGL